MDLYVATNWVIHQIPILHKYMAQVCKNEHTFIISNLRSKAMIWFNSHILDKKISVYTWRLQTYPLPWPSPRTWSQYRCLKAFATNLNSNLLSLLRHTNLEHYLVSLRKLENCVSCPSPKSNSSFLMRIMEFSIYKCSEN